MRRGLDSRFLEIKSGGSTTAESGESDIGLNFSRKAEILLESDSQRGAGACRTCSSENILTVVIATASSTTQEDNITANWIECARTHSPKYVVVDRKGKQSVRKGAFYKITRAASQASRKEDHS